MLSSVLHLLLAVLSVSVGIGLVFELAETIQHFFFCFKKISFFIFSQLRLETFSSCFLALSVRLHSSPSSHSLIQSSIFISLCVV